MSDFQNKVREALSKIQAVEHMAEQHVAKQQEHEAEQAAQAQAQAQQQAQASQELGAFVEAAYLVAAADGKVSGAESSRVVERLVDVLGGRFSQEAIASAVQEASARGGSATGRADAIAGVITHPELRRGALLAASAVAWLEGGVGQKEGLALQALARAFGVPIDELHRLMAEAHG